MDGLDLRLDPVPHAAAVATLAVMLLLTGWALNRAGVGVDVVARLATVTVVFTLFIYALVIISALKLRGQVKEVDNADALADDGLITESPGGYMLTGAGEATHGKWGRHWLRTVLVAGVGAAAVGAVAVARGSKITA